MLIVRRAIGSAAPNHIGGQQRAPRGRPRLARLLSSARDSHGGRAGAQPPKDQRGEGRALKPGVPRELKHQAQVAREVAETVLETGRVSLNQVLRQAFGLEVKKVHHGSEAKKQNMSEDLLLPEQRALRKAPPKNSTFWNPYKPNSPFRDKQKYFEQCERLRDKFGNDTYSAIGIVTEEDIEAYVDALSEDGSLKGFQGLSSMLVPKTLYSNVVKVALRVLQITLGKLDGQEVLGREVFLLRRKSVRSRWRVSKKYEVDEAVVRRLVRRIMADHRNVGPDVMGVEVQQQMYQNLITLVFRLVFDILDSCQLRCLGHTITINIETDRDLAEAPGWDIALDSGIFGRFDNAKKREFASSFVDDLLRDESINIKAMPDVFEKPLYINVVMLLFELLETACNHVRLHIGGISFRPALGDCKPVAK